MAILIGLKNEHASGSYHGAEGFEGFSIDTNSMVAIKEGKKSDLVDYVKKMRAGEGLARKRLQLLEDRLETDTTLSEEEYDKLYDELTDKLYLSKFNNLMIIEGEII